MGMELRTSPPTAAALLCPDAAPPSSGAQTGRGREAIPWISAPRAPGVDVASGYGAGMTIRVGSGGVAQRREPMLREHLVESLPYGTGIEAEPSQAYRVGCILLSRVQSRVPAKRTP